MFQTKQVPRKLAEIDFRQTIPSTRSILLTDFRPTSFKINKRFLHCIVSIMGGLRQNVCSLEIQSQDFWENNITLFKHSF